MDLAFRDLGGDGPPFVILHGLFGSSQNWVGMGRRLLDCGRCFLLDLRNHGDSPHSPEHSLEACVGDVAEWARAHAEGPLRLIGHSMGGLVAMGFAIAHPGLTLGIASLDIAPLAYEPGHEQELRALSTDLDGCRTRADLDARLSPILPDATARQFILTNAVRDGDGFRWRLDPAVLASSTLSEDFTRVSGAFDGPALLVAGGRSPYVDDDGRRAMLRHFPAARIVTIPEADHWLHVTAPDALERTLSDFLSNAAIPVRDPRH
jgi:pimeloyl-ACP methyl ester carboxylesterase